MFYKFLIGLYIFILAGCSARPFSQQDARYTGSRADALAPKKSNLVLVQASTNYQRSKLHQLIWGKHYRQVWAAPVPVPVLDLNNLPQKLSPLKLGGGLQTTSLSLTDPQGRTFTLRTLEKDPSKSLPPRLNKTFISNIMRDQTSAMNPYGAFTVPVLAQAAGVFHTNPKPYYVPLTAPGLGTYQEKFAGKLTMLEEKFENKIDLTPAFGAAVAVLSTEELFKQLDESARHQVDQKAMAKARLLDVIIGDWDRHEGQWTWAQYTAPQGGALYKPIPKDRDYAYYRYADGALTWLLSRRLLAGHIKPFIHNIPDVGGLVYKGRALDERLLNSLSAKDWQTIAAEMQAALTNDVLQKAMQIFPDTIYNLEGEKTFKYLQKRVNQLPANAQEYYRTLARHVKVMGSNQKEKFVVSGLPNKTTLVQVFTTPTTPGTAPILLYQRTFTRRETKSITLDGLGDADEYALEGDPKKIPKITIMWQPAEDSFSGKIKSRKFKLQEKK